MRKVGKAVFGYDAKPGGAWRHNADPEFVVMLGNRRLDAIENLIRGRHGGPCDTDEGGLYWLMALPHLVALLTGQFNRCDPIRWGRRWTPRFLDEIGVTRAERLVASHMRRPRFRTNAAIGRQLRVTAAECERFSLWAGIAPYDVDEAERQADARQAEAARKRKARAAKGAKPQAGSMEATKPWEAEGISRSTYKRRQARARSPQREPTSSGQLSTRVHILSYSCADEVGSPAS